MLEAWPKFPQQPFVNGQSWAGMAFCAFSLGSGQQAGFVVEWGCLS